jgi:hypothetical protein
MTPHRSVQVHFANIWGASDCLAQTLRMYLDATVAMFSLLIYRLIWKSLFGRVQLVHMTHLKNCTVEVYLEDALIRSLSILPKTALEVLLGSHPS